MDADQAAILHAARKNFPNYYAVALAHDVGLLDGLCLTRVALLIGINSPRPRVDVALRFELERTTDATERVFTELREAVRSSATFAVVPEEERIKLEQTIFEVRPPIPA